MLQLKEHDVTPPNGWTYLPAGSSELIRGGDEGQLLSRALEYHVAHDMPTADLAAVVEDELCRRTGALCAPPRPVPVSDGRSVTPGDVLRFLITMAAWLKNGTLVPQEEAERRAEICAGCRFNVDLAPGTCFGCSGVAGKVLEIIGERRTRMDASLRNCAVCSCFNTVSVWVPMPVLQKAGGDLDYPVDTNGIGTKCWKAKD